MFVKFQSHRQRDKATRLIGKRQGYYSLDRSTGKGVIDIDEADINILEAGRVKFTRLKGPHDDLMKCWPTEKQQLKETDVVSVEPMKGSSRE